MGGRVVLVAVSPRVPAGLLSWPAWEALRSGPVRTADAGSPQLPFLRDAGVDVLVEPPDVDDLHARALAGESVVWLAPDAELVRAVGLRSVPPSATASAPPPPPPEAPDEQHTSARHPSWHPGVVPRARLREVPLVIRSSRPSASGSPRPASPSSC